MTVCGPEPTPDVELVRVFATGDLALIALAQSLLDGEEIDYFVRGDGLQGLFGVGRSTGYELPARVPPSSGFGPMMLSA